MGRNPRLEQRNGPSLISPSKIRKGHFRPNEQKKPSPGVPLYISSPRVYVPSSSTHHPPPSAAATSTGKPRLLRPSLVPALFSPSTAAGISLPPGSAAAAPSREPWSFRCALVLLGSDGFLICYPQGKEGRCRTVSSSTRGTDPSVSSPGSGARATAERVCLLA